jgi:hypothetical protein
MKTSAELENELSTLRTEVDNKKKELKIARLNETLSSLVDGQYYEMNLGLKYVYFKFDKKNDYVNDDGQLFLRNVIIHSFTMMYSIWELRNLLLMSIDEINKNETILMTTNEWKEMKEELNEFIEKNYD